MRIHHAAACLTAHAPSDRLTFAKSRILKARLKFQYPEPECSCFFEDDRPEK